MREELSDKVSPPGVAITDEGTMEESGPEVGLKDTCDFNGRWLREGRSGQQSSRCKGGKVVVMLRKQ